MAAADTAKLVASLTLDARGFNSGVKSATASLGRMESTLAGVGRQAQRGVQNFAKNASLIGLGVAGALATQVVAGVHSLEELETAMNATAGVIKSTGGAAGVTAQQVRDLANGLEEVTTVDDKTIQQGENLLLTFTNIGKKVFPQATKATVDLAVAMNNGSAEGADLSASAIQIGKALNDPIKGVTALTKVGVSFTKQQKDQIKTLTESGDVVGAQTIILNELEKEFGQAGKAAGTGFGADMRRAQDAIEGAQQALATAFLPTISKVSTKLTTFLNQPGTQAGIAKLGTELAGAFDDILAIVEKIPFGAIGDSLRIAGIGAKSILTAFTSLPPWIQQAVITGWGLNKLTGGALTGIVGSLASGLIKGVLGINAGVVNINAATVNGAGGGIPGAAAGAAGGIGLAAGAAATVGVVIVGLTQAAAASLTSAVGGFLGGRPGEKAAAAVNVGANAASPLPIIGPLGRLFDALGGDFRSPIEKLTQTIDDQTAKTVPKLEDIKGVMGGLSQDERDARAAQLQAQKQAAADVASAVRPVTPAVDLVKQSIDAAQARNASDSASERAGVASAAAAQAAATSAAGARTAAAGQAAAAAIRDKDLSVKVSNTTYVSTTVSVRDSIKANQKVRSNYRVAS